VADYDYRGLIPFFSSMDPRACALRYATYSFSGIAGSTYVVKTLGARDALILGMGLYVAYVVAFWIATVLPPYKDAAAAVGAVLGGIGAGFLWTAQGAYFAQAATAHAQALERQQQGYDDGLMVAVEDTEQRQRQQHSTENSTAKLAGIFAFIYLAFEVGLRALSTILLETTNLQWSTIFAIYAAVTVASAILMVFVDKLEGYSAETSLHQQQASAWYKVTAAWQLLRYDPKMKHMIGLNAVFGFKSSFLSSYVNGEVVRVVMQDDESKYVGLYAAWVSCTAASMSLVFGRLAPRTGKGPILVAGSICFFLVVAPFLIWPNVQDWGWLSLVCIYSLHGTGRATFEGTLKATFADYFPTEKEGAFANIILQNGLSSALGFILTFTLHCSGWKLEHFGEYCVEYRDGSIHDVLSFELLIVLSSVLAIFGYWRASKLYADELVSRSTYESVLTYSVDNER